MSARGVLHIVINTRIYNTDFNFISLFYIWSFNNNNNNKNNNNNNNNNNTGEVKGGTIHVYATFCYKERQFMVF
jgi:hypothetical protein